MNQLQVIEHSNQRVLLTSQIAEAYGTTEKAISKNFSNNKDRYEEGKHYYILQGEELKDFFATVNFTNANQNKIRTLYLWTEKGALLHAKSLGTDKAWEVYDMLVETYFNVKQQAINFNGLSPELQMFNQMFQAVANQEQKMKQLETMQAETNNKINSALDVFTKPIEPNWREQTNAKINRICKEHGLSFLQTKRDLYTELEMIAHCDLSARQRNLKERMKKSGATYKECHAVSKIDIIDRDDALKAIFDGVVKRFQTKYIQGDDAQEGMFEE